MVIHREFRIPLPLSVEEYQVAQLFGVAEESKNETGGGDGVQVIENHPYKKDDGEEGQYTYKVYNIHNKVPSFVRKFAPKGSLIFHEKAWNSYPNCYTEYVNEHWKEKFKMVIISRHQPDNGTDDNINYGDYKEVDKSKMVTQMINISDNAAFDKNRYQESSDPTKYCLKEQNRGPFPIDFATNTKPIMTCYKYYYINCQVCFFKYLNLIFLDYFIW